MEAYSFHSVYGQGDIARLEAINKEAWEWLDLPAHYWWSIRDADGKEVGHAGLRVVDTATVFMGPTYVAPEARGNGLQRQALYVREEFARRSHYTRAITSTDRNNLPSANNLIRCGYLLSPPILKPHHPDDLWWKKELLDEANRTRMLEHLPTEALLDEIRARINGTRRA